MTLGSAGGTSVPSLGWRQRGFFGKQGKEATWCGTRSRPARISPCRSSEYTSSHSTLILVQRLRVWPISLRQHQGLPTFLFHFRHCIRYPCCTISYLRCFSFAGVRAASCTCGFRKTRMVASSWASFRGRSNRCRK